MTDVKNQEDVRLLIDQLQKALAEKGRGYVRQFLVISVNKDGLFSVKGGDSIWLKGSGPKTIEDDPFTGKTIEEAFNKLLSFCLNGGSLKLRKDGEGDQFDAHFEYTTKGWVIHGALQQHYHYRDSSLDD